MNTKLIDIPLRLAEQQLEAADRKVIEDVISMRATADEMLREERNMDALERVISAMRTLKEFSDYENPEFRALLVGLLFDLAEVHFAIKDYKQSEKEVETLFRVLDNMIKYDAERFGHFHILAMELSTRILRSRKKTLDMLVKQRIIADNLSEKVSAGVVAATDKLVDSLHNLARLMSATGDYRGAMKFFAEAIRISKKRAGRVTRKEIKMTIEMAEIMMRVRSMRPRARRLLNAVLPHAISLETIELEEDILAMVELIDNDEQTEPRWKAFMHKITAVSKAKVDKVKDKAKGGKTKKKKEEE